MTRLDVRAGAFDSESVRVQLHRRHLGAMRKEPLLDGKQDPWRTNTSRRPSTYGMDPAELLDYGRLMWRQGWQVWELREAFGIPEPDCHCRRHLRAA